MLARITLLFFSATVVVAADSASPEFFEKQVRPIFADHCYECHSATAKKVKGGLKLDTPEAIARGGESGALFVAGDPEKSLLIKAVRYADPDLQMPPKDKKLVAAQITLLEQWVKLGAPMPAASNQLSVISESVAVARTNWAFVSPRDPAVPKVADADPHWTSIDAFLIAKMEREGARTVTSARTSDSPIARTRPSALLPRAGKRTLIRRATYDLTGLPPTPEEVDAFVKDNSTNAFATLVERLLASPRYGEKWARHWLDVVRYTDAFDSRGIGGEADVPEAWRYRDWVVNAFNSGLPYDQFVMQQIAGDILATNTPGRFDTNALIATGVFAFGEWGGGDADKEKMLTDIVDDQIDVTGRGFLGLTLACARCHDHKFDPISTRDYYGLAGIFFSSHILPGPGAKTAGSPVLRIPLATSADLAARQAREQRVSELEKQIAAKSGVTLLTRAERGQLNQPTLSALHPSDGTDLPNAVANSGDVAINFLTIDLPAHALAIHPSPDKNAGAAWVSPLDGEVELSGRIADADGKCGNGIEWFLSHGTNDFRRGKFDNGGRQEITPTNLVVRSGELITLAVAPRGKDHSCDTTEIELRIRERGGEREWRLPQDVTADLPGRANTGAWHFIAFAGTPPRTLQSKLSDAEKEKIAAAKQELASLRPELERKIPVAHGLREGGTPQSAYAGFHDSPILIRGKYDRRGEVVPRQFPSVLGGGGQSPIADNRSGRLELAKWTANGGNPLTARVMVNRIWQNHFGEGIVRTPNNFGKLGAPPTHPELLDWLAHRFVESGWSIKAMHRLIMNSAAYQSQCSVISNQLSVAGDPANELFSRFNRRRLTAEELRDALLFVSGQIDFTMGGPSINDLATKRRTLYVMTIRSDKSNYRSLFDAPDAQTIAEKRIDSTVAPQALFLMNSPFVLKQAGALADRVLKREGDDAARVRWLYELLYSREPSAREWEIGSRVTSTESDRTAAWTRYCQVLLCANEFIYVD